MRHPRENSKFRINQKVNVPFSTCEGIIKGIRYQGENGDYESNCLKFLTVGWEYKIYQYSQKGYWEFWGWVEEKEIEEVNEDA